MNTETILNELKALRYNIGELIQRERVLVDQLVAQGVDWKTLARVNSIRGVMLLRKQTNKPLPECRKMVYDYLDSLKDPNKNPSHFLNQFASE